MHIDAETIFNKLNETRQVSTPTNAVQLDMFSEPVAQTQTTQTEYWHYSDLHNMFGAPYMPSEAGKPAIAQDYVWKKMYTPESKTQKFTQLDLYLTHTDVVQRAFYLNGQHLQNAKDLKVSRYACWCLTRNNPALIYAYTYFLSPVIIKNPTPQAIIKHGNYFLRVYLREELSELERQFAGIMKKCHIDYQMFYRNMTKDLFGGSSAEQLRQQYNIITRPDTPLADHMGALSLYARINLLRASIQRFNNPNTPKNANTFSQIVCNETARARSAMLKQFGILPEQDLDTRNISQVKSDLKTAETMFIKQYINQKIR